MLIQRFLAIACLATIGLPLDTPAQPKDWTAEGRDLAKSGQLEEALEAFTRSIRRNPSDPKPHIYAGMALLDGGRREDAEIELQIALGLQPTEPESVQDLAQILDLLNRSKLGLELLEKLGEEKLTSRGLGLMAELYAKQQNQSRALEVLGTLEKRNPSSAENAVKRGEILLTFGLLEEALTAFEQAYGSLENDPKVNFAMANTLLLGNNATAATGFAERAVELERNNPEYLEILAAIHQALGKFQEAIPLLEKAASLENYHPRIHLALGRAFRQIGESERARQELKTYQTLYNESQERDNREQTLVQLLNQGLQQLERGELDAAATSFRRALETDPENLSAQNFLAKIALSKGQLREAEEILEKLVRLAPKSSEPQYLLAFLLHQRRQSSKALPIAETARRLRPNHAELRNLLGNLYIVFGRHKEALQEYQAATQLAPDRSEFKANLESTARFLDP